VRGPTRESHRREGVAYGPMLDHDLGDVREFALVSLGIELAADAHRQATHDLEVLCGPKPPTQRSESTQLGNGENTVEGRLQLLFAGLVHPV